MVKVWTRPDKTLDLNKNENTNLANNKRHIRFQLHNYFTIKLCLHSISGVHTLHNNSEFLFMKKLKYCKK